MRNILYVLFACLFLILMCWFTLGYLNLIVAPQTLIQTYFGLSIGAARVSIGVALWIVVGLFGLVGAGAYFTRPRPD